MLWLLILIPALIGLYWKIQQRRKQFAARYGSFGLIQEAAGKQAAWRRHIPAALFMLGLSILLFALARPQMVVSLPKVEGTVILAFDVSGSMAATDFNPTRMEAAKAVAKDFVTRQPIGVQVGVVAFSDGGFSMQPPTNVQEPVLTAIERLKPARGTSLGNGILTSLDTIADALGQPTNDSDSATLDLLPTPTPFPKGTYTSAVIVLISDGENTANPDPLAVAQLAAERGVRIHTIGIGSVTGTQLEVNGFTVHTQLDEPTLQQIALLTDGTYYNAQTEEDLQNIYENIDPQLIIKTENTEVTSLFTGLGILVLLIGGAFSLLWFSRLP